MLEVLDVEGTASFKILKVFEKVSSKILLNRVPLAFVLGQDGSEMLPDAGQSLYGEGLCRLLREVVIVCCIFLLNSSTDLGSCILVLLHCLCHGLVMKSTPSRQIFVDHLILGSCCSGAGRSCTAPGDKARVQGRVMEGFAQLSKLFEKDLLDVN